MASVAAQAVRLKVLPNVTVAALEVAVNNGFSQARGKRFHLSQFKFGEAYKRNGTGWPSEPDGLDTNDGRYDLEDFCDQAPGGFPGVGGGAPRAVVGLRQRIGSRRDAPQGAMS